MAAPNVLSSSSLESILRSRRANGVTSKQRCVDHHSFDSRWAATCHKFNHPSTAVCTDGPFEEKNWGLRSLSPSCNGGSTAEPLATLVGHARLASGHMKGGEPETTEETRRGENELLPHSMPHEGWKLGTDRLRRPLFGKCCSCAAFRRLPSVRRGVQAGHAPSIRAKLLAYMCCSAALSSSLFLPGIELQLLERRPRCAQIVWYRMSPLLGPAARLMKPLMCEQ